jgi:hypothetical protein
MTRNFPRRLQRLEMHLAQQRLACHLDDEGRSIVERIRERRRRRLALEGREIEPPPPADPEELNNPPKTLSEAIRRARLKKRLRDATEVATEGGKLPVRPARGCVG